jgi:hypothetical protein
VQLIYPLLALILLAVFAWFINTYQPVPENMKKIVNLVLALIVVGMFLWLVNTYVPMAGAIKAIMNIVVVVATCVWVLKVTGLWDSVVRLWNNLVGHRIAP